MKKLHGVHAYVKTSVKSTFVPLKVSDCIPLSIPDIGLCFAKGVRMTPEITEKLAKYGGSDSIRIISGKKSWSVHVCRGILVEDLQFFHGLAKYIDVSYSGSARLITPMQLVGYTTILSLLSVQVYAARNAFVSHGPTRGFTLAMMDLDTSTDDEKEQVVISDVPDFNEKPVGEVKIEAEFCGKDTDSTIVCLNTTDGHLYTAWGTLESCTFSCGLVLPFSNDISMPDRNGISTLIDRGARLLDKKTVDPLANTVDVILSGLDRNWREGVMSTEQGEWISHMCASLELAMRIHASIFCVIKNGRYEGTILGGGNYTILSHGKVFVECLDDDFKKERANLDRHTETLESILRLLNFPAGTSHPKTLRGLRAMVVPRSVDGETQNKVSEMLPYLDFGQNIEPINLTTMKDVFSLLSLDDPVVSTDKYMDQEAFWAEDKETMVLSMFGRRAPVFSTGQAQRKLTIVARGAGSKTVADYDAKPPSVLQVVCRPLVGAALEWRGLLKNGMAKGNWELENKGNTVFRGGAKTELWAHMNDCLQKAIGKVDGGTAGDKRDREGDELEEGEIVQPPSKKTKEAFSYF